MNRPELQQRIHALATRSKHSTPLVMLTAYDYASARIVDASGVDLILVGDSAATTVLGYQFTRDIQPGELLMLTRAARRGIAHALMVGDLPHGSYEASDSTALVSAHEFAEAGCDLIKLEGAGAMLSRVRAIVSAGISVVGHVGLLPQSARSRDDLRARGRTAADAMHVIQDAVALEDAGCVALVIEAVPAMVADAVAARVSIPVIGIGAGANVDGQVLVLHDMLGLGDGPNPRFVREYAHLGELARTAIRRYAADVRSRAFPAAAEEYGMPEAQRVLLEQELGGVAAVSAGSPGSTA